MSAVRIHLDTQGAAYDPLAAPVSVLQISEVESSEGGSMNAALEFRARIFWALVVAGLAIGCLINW